MTDTQTREDILVYLIAALDEYESKRRATVVSISEVRAMIVKAAEATR